MFNDASYFAARADEERRLAMASADARVRRTHLEMAARYAVAAGADTIPAHDAQLESDRRTA
jgi:hypothetical protein